jgi:endonuclease/exonuclease/phosphatase family metal-dependent hydrolase
MKAAMSTTASTQPATENPYFAGRGRRWQLVWAAIAVLAIAVVGQGSIRTPTGPEGGTAFCGASLPNDLRLSGSSREGRRIRVGTFNIHGGRGLDGQRDLDRIAKCLEGLDFVALNEVHGSSGGEPSDNAEVLGRRLEVSWLFAPTERRWWHDHFGNGALSFYEVQSWQRIPLASHGSKSGRNAVLVSVNCFAGLPVRALVTHIDRSDPQRSDQLRTVIDLFLALAPPAILLGDLNTTSDDPLIQRLLAAPGAIDALAGTAAGRGRIDWIVSRGLKCTASGMSPAGPSDHPCFWADFVLVNGELGEGNAEWGMRNGE